jgi:long-chain acyl-CoA synthetase
VKKEQALSVLTAPGTTHELGIVNSTHGDTIGFVNAPKSLRDIFEQNLSDETFLVYEKERYTYKETYSRASQIGHLLRHTFDIQPGDRVAISMRNYPEWIKAFTAITSIGAIAVAMNALWLPEEMEYGLKDSGSKLLIADDERVERFNQCTPDLLIPAISVRSTRKIDRPVFKLEELLIGLGDTPMPSTDIHPNDPTLIIYTSGSTGRPKGVLSSHQNIITALLSWELDALANELVAKESEKDAVTANPSTISQPATLLAAPLFHVMGSHVVYLASYRTQRKIVCMYKWDSTMAAELIERENITAFSAPPAMTGDLARIAQVSSRDLSSLLSVGGGGAARAPEQVREIKSSFTRAMPSTGWGMTETNAIGTIIGGLDYLDHPSSAGRSLPTVQLRVVDDSGNPVPTGERGELQIRGPEMFIGYWNRPDVDAEVFDGDWFRTGDVAFIDEKGLLFIVDRIKDLIIRGGENIGCGTVEAALLAYPSVEEASAYSVPDERLGEEVAATIFCRIKIDLEELRSFLNQNLSRYEVPRYIRVSTEPLPRTESGKIFKRQLRETAIAELHQ